VNFYHQGSPGGSAGPRPTHYRLSWDGGSESTGIEVVGGNFVALDPDISLAPGSSDLVFDWYVDGSGTAYGGTNSDDFVIVTLVFGDGDTRVYIVPSQT
jgi:hypothetical protein